MTLFLRRRAVHRSWLRPCAHNVILCSWLRPCTHSVSLVVGFSTLHTQDLLSKEANSIPQTQFPLCPVRHCKFVLRRRVQNKAHYKHFYAVHGTHYPSGNLRQFSQCGIGGPHRSQLQKVYFNPHQSAALHSALHSALHTALFHCTLHSLCTHSALTLHSLCTLTALSHCTIRFCTALFHFEGSKSSLTTLIWAVISAV